MLNLDDARRYAAEIVDEVGPEFKYRTTPNTPNSICMYVPLPEARRNGTYDSAPSANDPREITGCLIGRILDRAGETAHRKPRVEARHGVDDLEKMFPNLFANDRVVGYLMALQSSQDSGQTWANAVADGEYWLSSPQEDDEADLELDAEF